MKETPYLIRKGESWYFQVGHARAMKAGWIHTSGSRAGKPKGCISLGQACTREEIARIRQAAQDYYAQYLIDSGASLKSASDVIGGYPADSLGAWFSVWTSGTFEDWNIKKYRTRDDYFRAWRYLEPVLGNRPIHKIEPNEFARLQRGWEERLSPSERFRVVKCARAIFASAKRHGLINSSPATILPNSMPLGRNAFFVASEIDLLSKTASKEKKTGMSLAIRTAWETAMTAVDVRTLCLSQICVDEFGAYIEKHRTKTEVEVYASISQSLWADIQAYIEQLRETLKIDLTPHAPIFRKRHGQPYRDRKEFGQDFARERTKALGADEKRQFQDIRRSANLEMRLGEASPNDRATLLANSLNSNRFLEGTYTPPTIALARQMVEKRGVGRVLLADKVGTRSPKQSEIVGMNETRLAKPLKLWRE